MKYDLIYADPPWRYEHAISNSRKIENKYDTMSLESIMSLVPPASDNCILFMWVTSPKLEEGLKVINAWGFNYRASLIWDKLDMGMGYWFRTQHEILLVATKGKVHPPDPKLRIRSIFKEKSVKHSKKPLYIYMMLNKWYPNLSKIELFSRQNIEGWSYYGNQVPKEQQKVLLV